MDAARRRSAPASNACSGRKRISACGRSALEPEDLFSESGGTRADHRPISNHAIERGYGRWLTYLARKGRLDDKSPAERITPVEVKGYIAELEQLGNRNSTICQRLSELRQMAMIMGPEKDWTFIKRFKARSGAEPPHPHGNTDE